MKVLVTLLAGCIGGGAGLDLPVLDVVYDCRVGEQTFELCWDSGEDSLEDSLSVQFHAAVTCGPTQRHLGPCRYHCDGDSGCNAYGGCHCP